MLLLLLLITIISTASTVSLGEWNLIESSHTQTLYSDFMSTHTLFIVNFCYFLRDSNLEFLRNIKNILKNDKIEFFLFTDNRWLNCKLCYIQFFGRCFKIYC